MGARMGRYLEEMVSMSSFMLPAVEIAWIVALRVALVPPIVAVAVPIAAGEEPRMGSAEEEDISWKVWEKEEKMFSGLGLGSLPVESK
jgi:hypothetical protein